MAAGLKYNIFLPVSDVYVCVCNTVFDASFIRVHIQREGQFLFTSKMRKAQVQIHQQSSTYFSFAISNAMSEWNTNVVDQKEKKNSRSITSKHGNKVKKRERERTVSKEKHG